jgi:hypothetical protein
MTRIRTLLATALAALTLVAVTACAAIPVSGDVHAGRSISDQSQGGGVDLRPSGPQKGASQEQMLAAFVEAATGAQNDYAVAREFLSSGFAQKWNPRQSVTVREGEGAVERAGSRELTYTLTASAALDSDGEYTQAVRPTSSTLTYQFTRQDGQWRISYAPDGIILSPPRFTQLFTAHALYFYDPTYRYLVPDERWFLDRSSTSTRVVSALLAGPSEWLKGAVVSSFPEGTQLSLNAVTIDNGSAQVDLSTDAFRANTVEKVRMREQLSTSLSSIATVSSVDLTVEGAPLSLPDSSGTSAQRDPDVDVRPLVVQDGAVGFATPSSGDVTRLGGGMSDAIAGLHPQSLALSASGTVAAVGTADGVHVVRSGKGEVYLDTRTDLVPPSLDDQGFVWVASSSQTGTVSAYGLGGDAHPLRSSLPAGRLVSFEVSRDSTRALALVDTGDGAALYVMAITRGSDRVPTSLGAPIRVQAADGDPVGATWTDDLDVASVGTTPTGTSVVRTTVGGQPTTLTRPGGRATTIVGGSGGALLLRTTDGSVLQSTNGAFDTTGVDAEVLGVQR